MFPPTAALCGIAPFLGVAALRAGDVWQPRTSAAHQTTVIRPERLPPVTPRQFVTLDTTCCAVIASPLRRASSAE